MDCLPVNLVIFGGGAVGLWLLDAASDKAPDLGGYVVLERLMER